MMAAKAILLTGCLCLISNILYGEEASIHEKPLSTEFVVVHSPTSLHFQKGYVFLSNSQEFSCTLKASLGLFVDCLSQGWTGVYVLNPLAPSPVVIILDLGNSVINASGVFSDLSRIVVEENESSSFYEFIQNSDFNGRKAAIFSDDDNLKVSKSTPVVFLHPESSSIKYGNLMINLSKVRTDAHHLNTITTPLSQSVDQERDENGTEFLKLLAQTYGDILSIINLGQDVVALHVISPLKDLKAHKVSARFIRDLFLPQIVASLNGVLGNNWALFVKIQSVISPKEFLLTYIHDEISTSCELRGDNIIFCPNITREAQEKLCNFLRKRFPAMAMKEAMCNNVQARWRVISTRADQPSGNIHNLDTWAEYNQDYAAKFWIIAGTSIFLIVVVIAILKVFTEMEAPSTLLLNHATYKKTKTE